jgi:hypothetical protein
VKPKQDIYNISFEKAVTANSRLSARITEHITMAGRLLRISTLLLLVISQISRKFIPIIQHSSKKPCLAY